MSDDEDDIWGYKSIRKCKVSDRRVDEVGGRGRGSGGRGRGSGAPTQRGGNRKRNAPRKTKPPRSLASPRPEQSVHGPRCQENVPSTPERAETMKTPSPVTPKNTPSGHCPSCQMPFAILLVQSPRWHVSECLDAVPAAQTECPDGLRCSSMLPSHYKRYSHFLLAQSRAADGTSFSPPWTPDVTLPKAAIPNCFSPARANASPARKSPKLKSAKSRSPSSSSQESVPRTPLDAWLLSPSKASQSSSSSSQESFSDVPAVQCRPPPQQHSDLCDSNISYSPLVSDQELFSDDEGDLGRSSPDSAKVIETPTPGSNDQMLGGRHDNGGRTRTQPDRAEVMGADYWSSISERSPGRLWAAADRISTSQRHVLPIKSEGSSQPCALTPQLQRTVKPASQRSPITPAVPAAKAMKQMDIGVFFGLKPKVAPAAAKGPVKTRSHDTVASQSEKPPRKRKAMGSSSDAAGAAENISGIPLPAATGTQKRGGKRFGQNSNMGEWGRGRKQCPFYKKIPGTGFSVDAFQYGEIEGCAAYFLTHFHSDHYAGLTKKFRFPIYCSKITGNLVQSKLRVEKEFIHCLPMYTECSVNGVTVVLLDANHCPGAVLLLFILPNGTAVLHTGDFRADTSMERYPALLGRKIHTLYLDTTYCSPEYTFPPQSEAVQFAVTAAFETLTLHPRTLVVCGTYSIGKEKVFLAIADVLGCKACMSQDKYKTMQCLESDEILARVTIDWHSTALHVLPMMQVHFKGLYAHLNKFSGKYDRVLAFKPTGWTYSEGCSSVAEIRPEIRGKVTLYGIPYSEHSSYSEMKRFVQFLKPQKIIPTVNVGNGKSRAAMEKHFTEWLSESR